ncbi:hypothetical protein MPSD_33610 [Mycobacterium pseudoshottsii JCM 15466]|uniref:Uncharacterized protein n=1 Tax=Mycobacterium pseudoshottsii TaxID=265949 RepID=A0A9N7QPH8_9MYCO|nr:hypothetical protein MPSD_33610 [Mycobacterium pseudoshottsii JCM 15466]BDN83080.1 hypothetical protein NJB1907Z4_C32950 [Mycobacterium pseudoshottsii]
MILASTAGKYNAARVPTSCTAVTAAKRRGLPATHRRTSLSAVVAVELRRAAWLTRRRSAVSLAGTPGPGWAAITAASFRCIQWCGQPQRQRRALADSERILKTVDSQGRDLAHHARG